MDILLVPADCKQLIQVALPNPKNGTKQHFLYDEDNISLYEITKYSEQFRSWFLENQLCQDGHFHMLTKIDPLYIFIPQLMEFCSQQFQLLQDICTTFASNNTDGSKLDYALSPDINWEHVCDTKDLDGDLFMRFSQARTIDWLLKKHERTVASLRGVMINQPSGATLSSYATDLIDQYLPPKLSDIFKDVVKNKSVIAGDTAIVAKPDPPTPKINPKRVRPQPESKQPPKGSIMNFFKRRNCD